MLPGVTTGCCGARPRGRQGFTGVQVCFFNVDWGGGHGRPSRCCRPLCTCGPPHSTLKRRPTARFPFRAARSHDWLLWSQTKRPTRVYRCSGLFFNVDWGGGHGRPSRCCRPLCTCGPPHSTLKRRPTARFPFRAARSHDWLLWSQTKRPTRVYRCSGLFFNVDWGGGHGRPSRCCRPLCTCGPPGSTFKRCRDLPGKHRGTWASGFKM